MELLPRLEQMSLDGRSPVRSQSGSRGCGCKGENIASVENALELSSEAAQSRIGKSVEVVASEKDRVIIV